jgi:uncharacterized protein YndB with AHSA1/START domain
VTARAPRPRRLVYAVDIDAPAEETWRAITDPEWTVRFFHETAVHTTWRVGTLISYDLPDGTPAIAGTLLEVDPPRRFRMTARFLFDETAAAEAESELTWEVEPRDGGCTLTLVHEKLGPRTLEIVQGGWPGILDGVAVALRPGAAARVTAREE